jgi:hypothetical protein
LWTAERVAPAPTITERRFGANRYSSESLILAQDER